MEHRTKRPVGGPRSADGIVGPHMAQLLGDPAGMNVPGDGPAELELRRRLFKGRALSAGRHSLLRSDTGRRINRILGETAAAWTHKPATLDQLTDCVNLCVYLARAVSKAERLARSRGDE